MGGGGRKEERGQPARETEYVRAHVCACVCTHVSGPLQASGIEQDSLDGSPPVLRDTCGVSGL